MCLPPLYSVYTDEFNTLTHIYAFHLYIIAYIRMNLMVFVCVFVVSMQKQGKSFSVLICLFANAEIDR